MLTVLAALPVIVKYMAPLASLLTLKLLNCAPLPFRFADVFEQLVEDSPLPPYQFTVLTADDDQFPTLNIPPFAQPVFTYLKQVGVVVMLTEPLPVITVQAAPLGVAVGAGVLVRVALATTVAVLVALGAGVSVLV